MACDGGDCLGRGVRGRLGQVRPVRSEDEGFTAVVQAGVYRRVLPAVSNEGATGALLPLRGEMP